MQTNTSLQYCADLKCLRQRNLMAYDVALLAVNLSTTSIMTRHVKSTPVRTWLLKKTKLFAL